jgi:hypothetical protein
VVRERWQQAQAEQRERERNAAARRLGDACGKANDAATKLAKSLAESDRLARDLLARRAEVEAAARTAGARDDASPRPVERRSPQLLWGAAGTGRNAPEGWRDEPSWADGIDVLRDVLQGGPRRPLHDAEVEAGRKEDERERQDRELLGWLRRNPGRAPEVLSRDGLSPALRAEVERIVAEAAERVAARQAAEAERGRAERRERAEQEAVA